VIWNDPTPAPASSTTSKAIGHGEIVGLATTWRLSFQAWLGLLLLGLALLLTITQASLLVEVIWVSFGAMLLSLAIRPLANALAPWRIPRGITVLTIYAGLAGALIILGNLLAPIISTEIARLQANGPALLQTGLSRIADMPLARQWLPSTDTLARDLIQRTDTLTRALVGAVAGVGGMALDMVILLVLAYFFATDTGMAKRLLTAWVPDHHQSQVQNFMARLRNRLTRWVWAQVAIAFYFAVVFSLGLTLLGVPFALTIGLTGGVLELIPYLGGAVSLLLAILSALSVSPLLVLWVVLFYAAVVEVEAHIIAPAFYGRVMGLHPAVVLIALLIGAKARGVIGVLFAVPVAVVLAAVVQEVQSNLALVRSEAVIRIDEEDDLG
jgi:predicted PurR-regulated permease PerM